MTKKDEQGRKATRGELPEFETTGELPEFETPWEPPTETREAPPVIKKRGSKK